MTAHGTTKTRLALAATLLGTVGVLGTPTQAGGVGARAISPPVPSVPAPAPSLPSVHVTPPPVPSVPAPAPSLPSVNVTPPPAPSLPATHIIGSGLPPVGGGAGGRAAAAAPGAIASAPGAGSGSSPSRAGSGGGLTSYGGARGRSLAPRGGTPQTGGRGGRDAARAAQLRLRDAVLPLQGCLSSLPDQLRLALQLGSGVGAPQALLPAAIARALRVDVRRVAVLQREGLRQLRLTAHARGCAAPTAFAAELFGGLTPAFSSEEDTSWAAGSGVAATREAKAPTPQRGHRGGGHSAAGGNDLLGLPVPPEAGEAMQVVLIALAGMLLLGLLFANELQLGVRARQWLWRRRHGPPV